MTPEDAVACAEAGVKVVAVSNHGGRGLDGTPGVAEVLTSVVAALGLPVTVTADGRAGAGPSPAGAGDVEDPLFASTELRRRPPCIPHERG